MTAFRLTRDVRPTRYGLRFDLDLEQWRFRGHEVCEIDVARPQREIVMHAAEIEMSEVLLHGARSFRPRVERDAGRGTVTFAIEEEISPGAWTLELDVAGDIRGDLKSLYRSTRGEERYAITTLWPAEAHRLYACFDEPRFKTRFDLELVTAGDVVAIANTQCVERREEGDRTTWRFATTEPLSPYLLAFAVGPFEATEEARTRSGTPVRIWVPRGLAGRGAYARDAQRAAIDLLEDYTGIPYPYDKVEGVGVADFPAGAMENPGAVTYRLELVTAMPGKASARALKASVGVAAHELTHMWWGNLVTLEWWDDVWLSESFATFVGNKTEDLLHPEWGIWRDFVSSVGGGFALDALASTHAIHADADDANDALQRIDAITYQKGAAVLRMLETYLGPETFQKGVRIYLDRFRGSVATAPDFWNALAEASGEDVGRIAKAWITQPGHPLLEIRADDDRLEIVQRRFFIDQQASSPERWPVPLVIRTDRGESRVLVDGGAVAVPRPAGAWMFPNAHAAGFYRFALDPGSRRAVLDHIDHLAPEERLFLLGNDWALLLAGRAHAHDHVLLLRALAGERDRAVLGEVATQLYWLAAHVAGDAVAKLAADVFGPVMDRLGLDVRSDDDEDTRELRDAALRVMGLVARDERVRRECASRVRMHLDGRAESPDVVAALAVVAATDGDAALQERYAERVRRGDPQEVLWFRPALGFFRDDAATERNVARVDDRTIRDQDLSGLFRPGFRNLAQRATYWRAYGKRFDARIRPLEGLVRNGLIQALSELTPPDLAVEADAFLERLAIPDAAAIVTRTREALRLQSAAASRIRDELMTVASAQ